MKEFLLANRDPALIGILALAVVVCALFLVVGIRLGMRLGRYRAERAFASRRGEERRDAVRRSRAVLGGQFSEQLAPYLPGFPGDPTEARFIGKPVDFISFSGSSRGKIDEVVFIEVKRASRGFRPSSSRSGPRWNRDACVTSSTESRRFPATPRSRKTSRSRGVRSLPSTSADP